MKKRICSLERVGWRVLHEYRLTSWILLFSPEKRDCEQFDTLDVTGRKMACLLFGISDGTQICRT